ncbi:hypothetical protein sr16847 [Sporisorium reilianum SRZ2]|uniref:Uncharacterized protein n=1 Tax=Sporisorium reilianum (strain SRZ2) TaxID=999809 RepID=E6ZWI3_SPORE|nr:hypothetical protein sr16847 [Sporisorium reilianum SRZ2]
MLARVAESRVESDGDGCVLFFKRDWSRLFLADLLLLLIHHTLLLSTTIRTCHSRPRSALKHSEQTLDHSTFLRFHPIAMSAPDDKAPAAAAAAAAAEASQPCQGSTAASSSSADSHDNNAGAICRNELHQWIRQDLEELYRVTSERDYNGRMDFVCKIRPDKYDLYDYMFDVRRIHRLVTTICKLAKECDPKLEMVDYSDPK